MSEICGVIAVFPIYSKFESIWKLISRCIVGKTYIVININLLSYKKLKTELENL